MDLQLSGRKALVSAGHKGIGLIVASRLLEEGAAVAICCRQQEDLDTALAALEAKGTAIGAICDFADPEAVHQWVNGANVVVDGGYTKQVGF